MILPQRTNLLNLFALEWVSSVTIPRQILTHPPKYGPNRNAPWQWHIEETFKGLVTLAVEALKILALVNGGAAVALISFCGNQPKDNPDVRFKFLARDPRPQTPAWRRRTLSRAEL
jgi:hypothetical protein